MTLSDRVWGREPPDSEKSERGRLFKVVFCLVGLFSATAVAQRTFVVDALNRPGTDFLDLPPAVQAANAGDTIQIRWAVARYNSVTVSKGITLMSLPQESAVVDGVLTIVNLPPDQRFV